MQASSSQSDSSQPVVGRLAPSPTGALHLGNARSFLLAWLSIRQQGGKLLLRIEDIDSPRVKPEAVGQTIEDLKWLGLDWDVSELDEELGKPLLQSSRIEQYLEVLEQLQFDKRVFRCGCSRKDVAEAASAPHDTSMPALEGDIYPGTCRKRRWSADEAKGKHCWRWHFESNEIVRWKDQFQGLQEASPALQLGDFVIAKFDGERIVPSYQIAVVVDDHEQQVTEVLRGEDLIYSTYRQLAIMDHLGWQPPQYYHVPLILGEDGRRLAKRHGDTRLSFFRESGIRAEAVVGYLAHSIGILDNCEPASAADLIGKLNWNNLRREPTVFSLPREMAVLKRLSR
ncbi:MAG: tRNA glutamyl-Q(34) synthetase GluQRS [Planctomycetota bacterium]